MSHLRREDDPAVLYQLAGQRLRIGRDRLNDLSIESDMRISRHHATVEDQEGQWVITDNQSANGTWVNGERVTSHALRDGDRIKLGDTMLVYVSVADPLATVTSSEPSLDPGINLSAREREILALVAAGSTDRQIGESLFISVATVRSHLDRMREKTGCRRRAELTRLAMDLHISE